LTKSLKPFQATVVENALGVLRNEVFDEPASAAYLLIEAPTGSGKTFMCGSLAERAARETQIVWFWFAPFAGLIRQTAAALREDAPGLRVRDVTHDRLVDGSRSGDTFVMTWGTVATERKESRRARVDDEAQPSIDHLILGLRNDGFRIGVIVDEAHHSFVRAKTAIRFYRDVLKPDVTVMVTATPDDKDLERFEAELGIPRHYALTVSRADAVEAGLIKKGIRTVAYLPDSPEARRLVDVRNEALRDGVQGHRKIKAALQTAGIPLTPLLLIQVASEAGKTIDDVRCDLVELGFSLDSIAVYTAAEPDDQLESLAADESKEVLIFKMAVALGFDAPRAFTLVTLRGSKDVDFGTQIVGRILRVHRRLQGRFVNELLNYGYVYLSDQRVQAGVSEAADRINAIATAFNLVAPGTVVVQKVIAGDERGSADIQLPVWMELFSAGNGMPPVTSELATQMHRYPLRPDMPHAFLTERLPLDSDRVLGALVESLNFTDEVLFSGLRGSGSLIRVEKDLFTHQQSVARVQGQFSPEQLARRAQKILTEDENLNVKSLQPRMLERLRACYVERGGDVPADLNQALNTILAVNPGLVRDAAVRCLDRLVEISKAAPVSSALQTLLPLAPSSRGIYGVVPPGLTSDERKFAEWLDNDDSGLVMWWHRNPVQERESVAVVRESGRSFFPDFLVGVRGREGGGILPVEVKGTQLLNLPETLEKVRAKHRTYGHVLMVNLNARQNAWQLVEYDSTKERAVFGGAFRASVMPAF